MDKDIQDTLLKDLRNASTVDKKLEVITLFLGYLGDSSQEQLNLTQMVSDNMELGGKATQEILKSMQLMNDTIVSLQNQISSTSEQIPPLMEHLTTIYNHISDISEDISKLYGSRL